MTRLTPGPVVFFGSGIQTEALNTLSERLGPRVMLLGDRTVASLFWEGIRMTLLRLGKDIVFRDFPGEPTIEGANELAREVHDERVTGVIGVGGGKAIDAAKSLLYRPTSPFLVTLPTSAATCAALTSHSVFYTAAGEFREIWPPNRCADAAIVDLEVIATAPRNLLAAGIADLVAKWVEARANTQGEWSPGADDALRIAEDIFEVAFIDGPEAFRCAGTGQVNAAFSRVVEAALLRAALVSGLGGPSARASLAHAVSEASTSHYHAARRLHGETVAVGVLALLLQDHADFDLFSRTRRLFQALSLPVSLSAIGVPASSPAQRESFARQVLSPGTPAHAMATVPSVEQLAAAFHELEAMATVSARRGEVPRA